MKVLKKNNGFTLVELIVVIAIVGILAAVLIPSLTGYIQNARKSSAEQDALSMYKEFIASVDVADKQELLEGNYVVLKGDYLVIIVKGALSGSFEIDDNTLTIQKKAFGANSITDLPSDFKYYILDESITNDAHPYLDTVNYFSEYIH